VLGIIKKDIHTVKHGFRMITFFSVRFVKPFDTCKPESYFNGALEVNIPAGSATKVCCLSIESITYVPQNPFMFDQEKFFEIYFYTCIFDKKKCFYKKYIFFGGLKFEIKSINLIK